MSFSPDRKTYSRILLKVLNSTRSFNLEYILKRTAEEVKLRTGWSDSKIRNMQIEVHGKHLK